MPKNNGYYDVCHRRLDKGQFCNDFCNRTIALMQSAFTYKNLPDSIPENSFERLLLRNGHCAIIENGSQLYAISGTEKNEGVYEDVITSYSINNDFLKLNKDFTPNVDCAIVCNDSARSGILPIIEKYCSHICDSEITLDCINTLSRFMLMITAPDTATKKAADIFIDKLLSGDFTTVGDNAFLDGIKILSPTTRNAPINENIELLQYWRATMFNELGIESQWNAKREALRGDEVNSNIIMLLPLIDDMLNCRKRDIEKVNELFNTDIEVELSSAWLLTHEKAEALAENDDVSRETEEENNDVSHETEENNEE